MCYVARLALIRIARQQFSTPLQLFLSAETLDDNGKMLYLTLEKAPQLTGLGPWMGVVQGEKQVNSDYPEEDKASVFVSYAIRRFVW